MVRLRIRAREVTTRILGDNDEWLVRGHRLSHRERPSTELLHEVPVADIRKVVDPEAIDVELSRPEFTYVQQEITCSECAVVGEGVEAEQVLLKVEPTLGA